MKKKDGSKFKAEDFVRWGEGEPDAEITPQQMFAMLQTAARGSRNGKS